MVLSIRKVAGTASAVVLAFLALADAPEQLGKWKRWWDAVVAMSGINWTEFLAGNSGRWFLLFAAVASGLWAWEVPQKMAKRYRSVAKGASYPFLDLSPDGGIAIIGNDQQEAADILRFPKYVAEMNELRDEVNQVTTERDALRQAHGALKRTYTLERLDRYLSNFPKMSVQIRTAGYIAGDLAIAEEASKLLSAAPGWSVAIDYSNNPPLPPASTFKMAIRTGDTDKLTRLQSFLDVEDGALLPCRTAISPRAHADVELLIFEILPTPTP